MENDWLARPISSPYSHRAVAGHRKDQCPIGAEHDVRHSCHVTAENDRLARSVSIQNSHGGVSAPNSNSISVGTERYGLPSRPQHNGLISTSHRPDPYPIMTCESDSVSVRAEYSDHSSEYVIFREDDRVTGTIGGPYSYKSPRIHCEDPLTVWAEQSRVHRGAMSEDDRLTRAIGGPYTSRPVPECDHYPFSIRTECSRKCFPLVARENDRLTRSVGGPHPGGPIRGCGDHSLAIWAERSCQVGLSRIVTLTV